LLLALVVLVPRTHCTCASGHAVAHHDDHDDCEPDQQDQHDQRPCDCKELEPLPDVVAPIVSLVDGSASVALMPWVQSVDFTVHVKPIRVELIDAHHALLPLFKKHCAYRN
jgi:hypothetical protein